VTLSVTMAAHDIVFTKHSPVLQSGSSFFHSLSHLSLPDGAVKYRMHHYATLVTCHDGSWGWGGGVKMMYVCRDDDDVKVMMWLFRLGLARDFSGSGRGSPVLRWGPNKVHCLSCPFLLFSCFSIII